MSKCVILNGRAMGQPMSGVPRYVSNLARSAFGLACEVVSPPLESTLGMPGHLWEQTRLPLMVWRKDMLLISPANTGPVMCRRQVLVVHDMATFDVPWAFSRRFSSFYQNLYRFLIPRVRWVVAISDFTKSRILHHFPCVENKISVIHNGTDHALDQSGPIRPEIFAAIEGIPYAFFVGSNDPRKNIRTVFDAVKAVRLKGGRLRVVVAGGSAESIFRLNNFLADGVSVIHVGRVSDAELRVLIANCSLFVFPSVYEGFGLPPLEALRLGVRRLVLSDIPVLRELMPAGATFVGPHDITEFELVFLRFLEGGLTPISEAAAQSVLNAYTWEKCSLAFSKLCEELS